MVKLWDPSDWSMTDLVEVYLGQMSTQEDFANILNEKFPHIAVDDI